jgi:hypothetical protein
VITYVEKNPSQKKARVMAQGVGLQFKSQYHKKEKKKQVEHTFVE